MDGTKKKEWMADVVDVCADKLPAILLEITDYFVKVMIFIWMDYVKLLLLRFLLIVVLICAFLIDCG